jgi:hypothetical protein
MSRKAGRNRETGDPSLDGETSAVPATVIRRNDELSPLSQVDFLR